MTEDKEHMTDEEKRRLGEALREAIENAPRYLYGRGRGVGS
jgi:hypothetical protein